jgi:hypothetical protein
MKRGLAPTRVRLALVCTGLVLVTTLASPTLAVAQSSGANDIPEELWQIYPLDPTKGDAGPPDTVQAPKEQPQTDSVVQPKSKSSNAQAKISEQSDAGSSLTLPVLGGLLGVLAIVLVVAIFRYGALAIAGEYFVRAGAPLAPSFRRATNAPRYVARGGAAVISPLRGVRRLPRGISRILLWPLRLVTGLVTHVFRRGGAGLAAAGQESRTVLRDRRDTLISVVSKLLLAAVFGVLVTFLLRFLQV